MSEKIPYEQVMGRMRMDIDYIAEEAYQKGIHDGSIDVKERVNGAYQKGFEAGQHEATTLEYQQGLDDAWECMKAIAFLNKPRDMRDFFGCSTLGDVLIDYTASEAIEKLKAYEERQKSDEIKVGDEVDYKGMTKYVVTGIVDDDTICGFSLNGLWNANTIKEVTKTGRHFPQVGELLKEMKEGAE